MKELFAKLKRLLEPRPPAETLTEPTADRPPPPAAEPPTAEAPRRVEAQPRVDVDDLAEVRAALEAVAEPPAAAAEPEPPTPEPPEPEPPTPEPEPLATQAETLPPVPAAATRDAVEAPTPAVEIAGDALVLTLGSPPATFSVAKTSATIGRGQENTIRLDDLSVSRRHARIAYRQGGYWLSDLGSMGGTWVAGARLSAPRRIAAGEVIDIGHCRLTVSFAGASTKAETKKGPSKTRSGMATPVRRRR
ncbi:MAG: FHA domain-containing protein [Chloroflexota bacterium]